MTASPHFPKIPATWFEDSHFIQNDQIHLRVYQSKNLSWGRWLYLVHGQGEQSDRYEHFPFYLNGVVDAIVCIDLPGHGKSKGIRGHIENFDQYTEAVLTGFRFAQDWMKTKAQRCEAHWFGHSLGGLITLRTLLKENHLDLASVTTSAPLLDLAMPVPVVKKFFAELVEPFLGSVKLGNELDGSLVSRDAEVGKSYGENPLNHNFVTPRFFVNLIKEMSLLRSQTGPFAYNYLMLVPLADKIVNWKASYQFFADLKMKEGFKKELTSFPHFYHESFNEIEKGLAFNAFADWLKKNSKI